MSLSRVIYRLEYLNRESEFFIIFLWILFFPFKQSLLYFFTVSILLITFLILNIRRSQCIGLSRFNQFLILLNLLLLVSVFFAQDRLKSLLAYTDILLMSIYFFFYYQDPRDTHKYYSVIFFIISTCSTIYLVNHWLSVVNTVNIFFENPILQGIVSGAGVILSLIKLLEKPNLFFYLFLFINLAATYATASKTAFLSVVIFTIVIAVLKKKKLLIPVFLILVLTSIVPNPVRNKFQSTITKDPYAANRLDIWAMSWRMFTDHPLTGIGFDHFSDIAPKYNFKQPNAAANYLKCPRMAHNDYLKLLAESGILGLVLLFLSMFFLIRRLWIPPVPDITKLLILYLLFHALFINILFNALFLFWLLFMVRILFDAKQKFIAWDIRGKFVITTFLLFVLTTAYLFPYMAEQYVHDSGRSHSIIEAYNLLKEAEKINPLESEIYYTQALILYNYFRKTSDIEVFSTAIERLKKAQSLNKYFLDAYLLESQLFMEMVHKNLKYVHMEEEILRPLNEAEKISPYNPFIKLRKAIVYFEFDKNKMAEREALRALEVEPNFIAAHYFLHSNFSFYANKTEFRNKMLALIALRERINPAPGSYLDKLFFLPKKLKQEQDLAK